MVIRLKNHWITAVSVAIVLCLYIFTLAPAIFPLDSAELIAGAHTLGIVHGPGYPVYLLIAHFFSRIPIGDVAYRVNLLSAFSTICTIIIVISIIIRITRDKTAAIIAGVSFGLSYYVWSISVIAEVYSLQTLFLAVMLLAATEWHICGNKNALIILVGVMGAALVNSPATLLWWPGLLLLISFTPYRRSLTRQDLLKMGGIFTIGLLPLIYLPLRYLAEPPLNYAGYYNELNVFHAYDLTNPRVLFWYLTGQQFSDWFFVYRGASLINETVKFFHHLLALFLGVGLPLGLLGFWALWGRNKILAAGIILTALPHAFFFIAYSAFDKEMMFTPVYLVWTVFVGVGIHRLIHQIPSKNWAYVFLLIPIALTIVNLPRIDTRNYWKSREMADQRLASSAAKSIYFAAWGDASSMEYLQFVEGVRTDVQIINPFLASAKVRKAITKRALKERRAVYVSFEDPALLEVFELVPIEYGFEVSLREEYYEKLDARDYTNVFSFQ